MSKPRLRKPRFERCPEASGLMLTERDVSILSVVSRHRLIRSDHVLMLVAGSRQHLIRRLSRLFHAGYLDRPMSQKRLLVPFNAPLTYCLAARGQKELQRRGIATYASIPRLRSPASVFALSHALRVTDVLAAFERKCVEERRTFLPSHQWPGAKRDRTSLQLQSLRWFLQFRHQGAFLKTSLIPDAAFAIGAADGNRSYFLLEVDRGTMPVTRRDWSQSSFAKKIIVYQETRRAGVLWKRWQIPGFRVLVVAESQRRLTALQRATAKCFARGVSEMFLFTVASELLSQGDLLNHAWHTCAGRAVRLIQTEP